MKTSDAKPSNSIKGFCLILTFWSSSYRFLPSTGISEWAEAGI